MVVRRRLPVSGVAIDMQFQDEMVLGVDKSLGSVEPGDVEATADCRGLPTSQDKELRCFPEGPGLP